MSKSALRKTVTYCLALLALLSASGLSAAAPVPAVVELNEKVLYVKTFAPVARPGIYLKDLHVAEGDTVKLKPGARE